MAVKSHNYSDTEQTKERPEDIRGKGFPQILHDRAKDSADRLQSLLLSLSTALVGVAFFALTSEVKPELTGNQRYALLLVLITLGTSVIAGLFGMRAETQRYVFHALALQNKQMHKQAQTDAYFTNRDRWLHIERMVTHVQEIAFVLGIVAIGVYTILRIFLA
jgi:hypothetical protein